MYSETLSGPQSRNKFSWEIQLGTSVDVTKAKAFSCCVLAIEFWDFFWPSGTVSVHLRMIVMHNSNRSLPTEFDAKYRRYQRKKFKFPVLLLSSVGRVRIWGQNRGAEEGGGGGAGNHQREKCREKRSQLVSNRIAAAAVISIQMRWQTRFSSLSQEFFENCECNIESALNILSCYWKPVICIKYGKRKKVDRRTFFVCIFKSIVTDMLNIDALFIEQMVADRLWQKDFPCWCKKPVMVKLPSPNTSWWYHQQCTKGGV